MKIKVLFVLLFAILLVVFAVQNTEIVNIKLIFWDIETPKALLIFICFALGVLFGFLVPSSKKAEKNNGHSSAEITEE